MAGASPTTLGPMIQPWHTGCVREVIRDTKLHATADIVDSTPMEQDGRIFISVVTDFIDLG